MAEIYQLPDTNSGNAGMGNIPFSIPIGGFGMGGGLFGGNFCLVDNYQVKAKKVA